MCPQCRRPSAVRLRCAISYHGGLATPGVLLPGFAAAAGSVAAPVRGAARVAARASPPHRRGRACPAACPVVPGLLAPGTAAPGTLAAGTAAPATMAPGTARPAACAASPPTCPGEADGRGDTGLAGRVTGLPGWPPPARENPERPLPTRRWAPAVPGAADLGTAADPGLAAGPGVAADPGTVSAWPRGRVRPAPRRQRERRTRSSNRSRISSLPGSRGSTGRQVTTDPRDRHRTSLNVIYYGPA